MAYNIPVPATTGELFSAARFNTDVVDNILFFKVSFDNAGKLATIGGVLTSPELKGYRETLQTVVIAGGGLVIDLLAGNHVNVTLNANITSITVNNIPGAIAVSILVWYIADGTQRTIVHTINGHVVKFSGGAAFAMTATAGKIDKVLYSTRDGSATWTGEVVAQNE